MLVRNHVSIINKHLYKGGGGGGVNKTSNKSESVHSDKETTSMNSRAEKEDIVVPQQGSSPEDGTEEVER